MNYILNNIYFIIVYFIVYAYLYWKIKNWPLKCVYTGLPKFCSVALYSGQSAAYINLFNTMTYLYLIFLNKNNKYLESMWKTNQFYDILM